MKNILRPITDDSVLSKYFVSDINTFDSLDLFYKVFPPIFDFYAGTESKIKYFCKFHSN